MNKKKLLEVLIKEYEPVEDTPGYVWFDKRNLQIIKIEVLSKVLGILIDKTSAKQIRKSQQRPLFEDGDSLWDFSNKNEKIRSF